MQLFLVVKVQLPSPETHAPFSSLLHLSMQALSLSIFLSKIVLTEGNWEVIVDFLTKKSILLGDDS